MTTPRSVKWVFLDLDGTLLRPDQTISTPVAEAVGRLRQRVPVSIATGRERLETIRFAADLELTALQICDGGAVIFDMPNGDLRWSKPLGAPAVAGVMDALRSSGSLFFATHPDGAYTNLDGEVAELPWVTTDPGEAEGLAFTRISALDLSEREARSLAAELSRLGLNTARAYLPYNGLWAVDFTDPEANKGTAVSRAAKWAGVALSDCIAIGDSFNDLPMLEACGVSIAMGGAPPEVVAAADHAVPCVEQDGLALAIDEFVLPLLPQLTGLSG
jgi:Cof subfamily protein (haloacid dehalogenase superfamily)